MWLILIYVCIYIYTLLKIMFKWCDWWRRVRDNTRLQSFPLHTASPPSSNSTIYIIVGVIAAVVILVLVVGVVIVIGCVWLILSHRRTVLSLQNGPRSVSQCGCTYNVYCHIFTHIGMTTDIDKLSEMRYLQGRWQYRTIQNRLHSHRAPLTSSRTIWHWTRAMSTSSYPWGLSPCRLKLVTVPHLQKTSWHRPHMKIALQMMAAQPCPLPRRICPLPHGSHTMMTNITTNQLPSHSPTLPHLPLLLCLR